MCIWVKKTLQSVHLLLEKHLRKVLIWNNAWVLQVSIFKVGSRIKLTDEEELEIENLYFSDNFEEIDHPKTHVTLGQYKNCRIPVSEPLTPEIFITFLLRNFYNPAFRKHTQQFILSNHRFSKTITDKERAVIHIGIY